MARRTDRSGQGGAAFRSGKDYRVEFEQVMPEGPREQVRAFERERHPQRALIRAYELYDYHTLYSAFCEGVGPYRIIGAKDHSW